MHTPEYLGLTINVSFTDASDGVTVIDPASLPTTEAAAEAAGSRWWYPGVPCGRGHVAPRLVGVDNTCALCCAEYHVKSGGYTLGQ
ncbi:MAG TPA: hypothetical protein VF212_00925 [Longimicrobiales bacterium]